MWRDMRHISCEEARWYGDSGQNGDYANSGYDDQESTHDAWEHHSDADRTGGLKTQE